MHWDLPQIGSFQGDKLLVGNLVSLLFWPHHQSAEIQMSEVFVKESLAKNPSKRQFFTLSLFFQFAAGQEGLPKPIIDKNCLLCEIS